MLCGDVSLNRDLNVPVDSFMVMRDQCLILDGKEFNHTMIAHNDFLQNDSEGLILLRLHFVVHSFINLYVEDPVTRKEVAGQKLTTINQSTTQSHLLTLDKKVCQFNLKKGLTSFDPKEANFYRNSEGLVLSDFDKFMSKNNQIV